MTSSREATAGPGLRIESLRGEAHQLDTGVRADLERSLGASFGDVVVHTGAVSAAAAYRLNAAAFTVGRHVVFGSDAYDPSSARGRMLLAHELAHVVQQRRGGTPDLGEAGPGSAPAPHTGAHNEHAVDVTAAQAALGMSAPVTGAAPVGVARKDKDEEGDWKKELLNAVKLAVRQKVKAEMGQIEGIPTLVAGYVDSLIWIPYAEMKLTDKAIDTVGSAAGLEAGTRELIKAAVPNSLALKAIRAEATALEIVDKDTGDPSATAAVSKFFDAAELAADKTVFAEMAPEEGFFTERELNVLGTVLTGEIALAVWGPEEIELILKVVSGADAIKGIYTAMSADPTGFYKDQAFWIAMVNALLHFIGLKMASVGRKITALVIDVISLSLNLGNHLYQLAVDFQRPRGPERDQAVKNDVKVLFTLLIAAIRQFITHNRAASAAQRKAQEPGSPASAKAGGPREPQVKTPPAEPPVTASADVPAPPAKATAGTEPLASGALPAEGGKTSIATENAPADSPALPDKPPAVSKAPAKEPQNVPGGEPPGTGIPAPVAETTTAKKVTAGTGLASSETQPAIEQPNAGAGKQAKIDTPAGSDQPAAMAGKAGPATKGKAKADTLSETRRKAEAGRRMEAKAAERHGRAQQVLDDATKAADAARARLAAAKAMRASEPAEPSAPGRKLSPGEKELRAAQRALKKAEIDVAGAKAAVKGTADALAMAKGKAQAREAAHEAAKKADAERQAQAAQKAKTKSLADITREKWEKEDREAQAKVLRARKGEQLHHAIELQVLDIPEFEGAVTPGELTDISNIRLVPMEISPEDAALLDVARRTPREQWPKEVQDAVELAPVKRPGISGAEVPGDMVPVLKDRSPEGRPSQLHQSKVREMCDKAYADIKAELAEAESKGQLLPGTSARRNFVRARLFQLRKYIDTYLGTFWGQAQTKAGTR